VRWTQHLAIGVDFSEPSQIALQSALTFAALVNAQQLTVLHAVPEVILPQGDQPALKNELETLRQRMHQAAHAKLEAVCAQFQPPTGLTVTHQLVEGAPAQAIPQAAARAGAGCLIVGTHGRRGLRRWLRGSVAESMLQGAPLPILVTHVGHDGVAPQDELRRLDHVLVAVDLPTSAPVLEAAVSLSEALPKSVRFTVLHVIPDNLMSDGSDDHVMATYRQIRQEHAKQALAQVTGRFPGQSFELQISSGDVDESIVATGRTMGAELLVVGSHGSGSAPLLGLGSSVGAVVRQAPVSVLVVPCSTHEP